MIRPPLDVAAAARLSTSLHLEDVICIGLSAKHIGATHEVSPAEYKLSWEMPNVEVVWELDNGTLKVLVPFTLFIEAHPSEGVGEKRKLAEIGVAFRLEYDAKKHETWSEEDLPHYAGITSFLHAWPYLRAEVQHLSTKIGFPPLLLPVVVSGYAAKRVTVRRLRELKAPPPLPRRTPKRKSKTSAE